MNIVFTGLFFAVLNNDGKNPLIMGMPFPKKGTYIRSETPSVWYVQIG